MRVWTFSSILIFIIALIVILVRSITVRLTLLINRSFVLPAALCIAILTGLLARWLVADMLMLIVDGLAILMGLVDVFGLRCMIFVYTV